MKDNKVKYGLSDTQYEAVSFGNGPLMVLAGPGSGKTTVITNRVRYLIEELDIRADHILVVTFSRAAAIEMKERFNKFSVKQGDKVTFGTFHSVYFSFIKMAYGYSGRQVATDEERYSIINATIRRYHIESGDIKNLARDLLSEIALIKEEKINLTNYYSNYCSADIFRRIFTDYEENLVAIKKIDFEDMLLMTYDLLDKREDIRKACQEKYQYILVDEFQDINRMQYEIIKMIAGKKSNLTIVGDDDQSIYRFRGAKPEIMLGFDKDYPNLHTVILDTNYRSSEYIVEGALRLINHNEKRYKKNLHAAHNGGKQISIDEYKDVIDESKGISEDIKAYIRASYKPSDIAILYRTNLQPRMLIHKLIENNISFTVDDNIPDIMDHFIAKDIMAYLRLSAGNMSRSDLIRVLNRPLRYIKRDALSGDNMDFDGMRKYYESNKHMMETINSFEADIDGLPQNSIEEAIRYIRRDIGYDLFLKQYASERELDVNELYAVADELEESGIGFNDYNQWQEQQRSYNEAIIDNKSKDAVRLMTMHASKGLEFKIVYVLDANEGITPYRKAISKDDIEEERRMFYVAMTRAKERLHIAYCKLRMHRRTEISRFVREIT